MCCLSVDSGPLWYIGTIEHTMHEYRVLPGKLSFKARLKRNLTGFTVTRHQRQIRTQIFHAAQAAFLAVRPAPATYPSTKLRNRMSTSDQRE